MPIKKLKTKKIKVKKDPQAKESKPVKCTVNITKVTKIIMVSKNKFEGYGWRDMVWAFALGIVIGVIISKV